MGKKEQRGIEILGYSKMSSGNGEGVKIGVTYRWKKGLKKSWKLCLLIGEWSIKILGYSKVNTGMGEEVKFGVTKRWKEAMNKSWKLGYL